MKSKRYVPVSFTAPNNETYDKEYSRIFRKGKDKGKGKGDGTGEAEAEPATLSPFRKVISRTGGHRKIYTYNADAKLKDLG